MTKTQNEETNDEIKRIKSRAFPEVAEKIIELNKLGSLSSAKLKLLLRANLRSYLIVSDYDEPYYLNPLKPETIEKLINADLTNEQFDKIKNAINQSPSSAYDGVRDEQLDELIAFAQAGGTPKEIQALIRNLRKLNNTAIFSHHHERSSYTQKNHWDETSIAYIEHLEEILGKLLKIYKGKPNYNDRLTFYQGLQHKQIDLVVKSAEGAWDDKKDQLIKDYLVK